MCNKNDNRCTKSTVKTPSQKYIYRYFGVAAASAHTIRMCPTSPSYAWNATQTHPHVRVHDHVDGPRINKVLAIIDIVMSLFVHFAI